MSIVYRYSSLIDLKPVPPVSTHDRAVVETGVEARVEAGWRLYFLIFARFSCIF